MAYKSWKGKSETGQSDAPSSSGDGDFQLDLGSKKKVTVRKYGKTNLVDIREYYEKDGKSLPGKKGISLTEDLWNQLLESSDEIKNALSALNEDPSIKRKAEEELEESVQDDEKPVKKIKSEE